MIRILAFSVTVLSFLPPGSEQSDQKAEWWDRRQGECSGAPVPGAAGSDQKKSAGPWGDHPAAHIHSCR